MSKPIEQITCPDCGSVFDLAPRGKPRSGPQLRRFMSVCQAAFAHWPEKHAFRPSNWEHLRYFLEKEAGYFHVVKTIRCETVKAQHLAEVLKAVMSASDDYRMFIEVDDNAVVVKRVDSIAYRKLPHLSACALFNDVDEVIHKELGVHPDKLLKEERAAA